jgi:hypothetical protein
MHPSTREPSVWFQGPRNLFWAGNSTIPIGIVGIRRYTTSVVFRIPFSFPNPVDEVSARLVATGVVAQGLGYLLTRSPVLLVTLAFGFAARVGFGPRFSPLGRTVTKIVRPMLSATPKFVAGAPKRFAQGVGLAFSGAALSGVALGYTSFALVAISLLVIAATLEAAFAFCLGCVVFRWLMRVGLVPSSICESCSDISAHIAALSSSNLSSASLAEFN